MPKPTALGAERELARRDAVIRRLVEAAGPCTLGSRRQRDHFGALVRGIVFQQLAGKAAIAIHTRFVGLFDGRRIDPEAVLAAWRARLRAAGLSEAQALCIIGLASEITVGKV